MCFWLPVMFYCFIHSVLLFIVCVSLNILYSTLANLVWTVRCFRNKLELERNKDNHLNLTSLVIQTHMSFHNTVAHWKLNSYFLSSLSYALSFPANPLVLKRVVLIPSTRLTSLSFFNRRWAATDSWAATQKKTTVGCAPETVPRADWSEVRRCPTCHLKNVGAHIYLKFFVSAEVVLVCIQSALASIDVWHQHQWWWHNAFAFFKLNVFLECKWKGKCSLYSETLINVYSVCSRRMTWGRERIKLDNKCKAWL